MLRETGCRIELLGGLRVRQGDRILTRFETRKTAALLAALALGLHRSHSREALLEQLWPEEDPDATRVRFRQALAALRRALEVSDRSEESILIADRADVRLDPAAVTTDVAEFEETLRLATQCGSAEERARILGRAVALYTGELLPGFYEEWIVAERERLAEAQWNALCQLAAASAEIGDLSGAIAAARRAVTLDPLREEGHGTLMRLYAAAGRPTDALRQYREMERILREELDTAPSAAVRALAEVIKADGETGRRGDGETGQTGRSVPSALLPFSPSPRLPVSPSPGLEPVGGAVPLGSSFYIERREDGLFAAAIARRDSIVLVKGPRQIGKTSLLARGMQQARETGARVVLSDLRKFTAAQLASTDTLFLMLAEAMAEQLGLETSPESVWNPRRGWNVNFERYLRREVLSRLSVERSALSVEDDAPFVPPQRSTLNAQRSPHLVWELDEVDRLFHYPFGSEVFGLFRSWHEERALDPASPWAKLTLAMAYATEAHLFITDLNQSPFNVGTRVTLEDFTREQVAELNRRHSSPLSDPAELDRFFALVGGHPYLVRRGLHEIVTRPLSIAAFEAEAIREEGFFRDELRRIRLALAADAELCEAVRSVLRGESCPTAESFYRLRSAGVLAGDSAREARPRCHLYRLYLSSHPL